MAHHSRQQQHFSRQITAPNRQSVNDQAAAASFNHPVQMASANPFATTTENPWLGMNHMLLGSNGQTYNPMTSTHNGPANSIPDDRRKRPMANQVDNNEKYVYFSVPDYAPQNIKDDMIRLRETQNMLFEQSKRLRIQFAEKQNQAVQHLVESVRTPIEKKLKDKDEEIVTMQKLNTELQKNVENLRHENKKLIEYGMACKIQAMTVRKDLEVALAEVSRLQGLVPPNGTVAGPSEEQDLKSKCQSTLSGNNTQRNAQVCRRVKVEDACEIAAEVVQIGAAETGEGSGEKKMCKSCGEMELSVLALPCRHLCFCIVCGIRESGLHGPCPVCDFTMTATVPVSLV